MTTAADIQEQSKSMLPGLLGIEFREVTQERVVATLKVRPELCTTNGILHGGSIMAFADTLGAVGTSMNLKEGSGTTTVESSTKFVAAAPVGTTVTGECTPFHRGRTTMVWQTLVRAESGRLCAVVTQTQLVLTRP